MPPSRRNCGSPSIASRGLFPLRRRTVGCKPTRELLSAGGMSIEIAFAEFAASLPPDQKRERGGIVLAIENHLEFQELPNRSRFDNRYIAVVPAIDRLPGPLVGFWHTHLNSPLPSLTDLLQLVRANKRFGQSF